MNGSNPEDVENLTIPSDGKRINTTAALAVSQDYVITAYGTSVFDPWGNLADARVKMKNGEILPCSWLHMMEKGNTADSKDGWGSYQASHKYSLLYTGQGVPLEFYISDSNYDDNSGALSVGISKLNY